MDDREWFFSYDGQSYGPYDWPTMCAYAVRGDLLPFDFIWTEGWDRWVHAGDIENFLPVKLNPLSPSNRECYSSRPGKLALSRKMLRRFPNFTDPVARYQRCLGLGDSQPAFVMQILPVIVASQSDETDCVVLLRFNPETTAELGLVVGARLMTTNFYDKDAKQRDLVQGPSSSRRWGSIYPMVADFLSADAARITALKQSIPENEWQIAWNRGCAAMRTKNVLVRDGSPFDPIIVAL